VFVYLRCSLFVVVLADTGFKGFRKSERRHWEAKAQRAQSRERTKGRRVEINELT
jgi:hypothetical protein